MSLRETVVRCARAQLGDQYQWGTAGPDTFDCSGLVSYCYKQAGVTLSRSSHEQARSGRSIPRAQAQPGDILVYGNGSHVGLVTGPNEAIHALNPTLDIRVTKIDGANLEVPLTDVRSVLGNEVLVPPDPPKPPPPPPDPNKRPRRPRRPRNPRRKERR